MSLPYVTSAKFTSGGITLSVLVNDFEADEYVEISGNATQSGGAFANIYSIAQIPASPSGKASVDVTATPLPPRKFRKDQDVTVVIRVAKVWLTVLGEQNTETSQAQLQALSQPTSEWHPPERPDVEAGEGTTWNKVREVSEIYAGPPPTQGGTSQQLA